MSSVRAAAAASAALVSAALLPACGTPSGEAGKEPPRVVILGIDGFDWNLVDPLVEAGRMPVMKGLLAKGTRADLLSLVPLEKSPVIWTTIATGRLPSKRGRGFLVPTTDEKTKEKRQVYTAWNRTTRAFWNILSEEGVSVSVLGWLETWPAEPVRGTLVTDYVKYFVAEGAEDDAQRRTYPPELYAEVESLVVYARDIPVAGIRQFLGADPGPDPPQKVRDGLNGLRWIWAGDLTFAALARHFLRDRPEEVMAVYLRGPDAVCHQFWGDRDHLAAGKETRTTELFGETIDLYLEETDRLLGEILEEIDLERTTLLLVSDHGFQGLRTALDGSTRLGIYMHRELGTLLIAGPWAAGAGIRGEGVRVQDVLPTLLHGLGLPVADDLDGQVARSLLGPRGGGDREIRTIPTYERGPLPRAGEAPESPVAGEIQERLEALGYVE